MIGLTRRQHDLLACLERNQDASVCEMRDALGLKAKSGIIRILDALEERGFIRRLRYRARSVEVLHPPPPPSGARVRVVYGPGHFEDLARLRRAEYAREGAEA